MSLGVFFAALAVALMIIAYSVYWIKQSIKKTNDQKIAREQADTQFHEGRQKIIESIHILLKVVGTEELGWMEACIRIKVLLDRLSMDLSTHPEIGIFYTVYSETEHIPTHDAWNALPKQAKVKFRLQMQACEDQHIEALKTGKAALLAYPLV